MKYLFWKALQAVFLVPVVLFSGTLGDLAACNVPAFRYALERWAADPYQLVIYHQTPLQGEQFELLRKGAAEQDQGANYVLKTIDVTAPAGQTLAKRRNIPGYPWVEVFYPAQSQAEGLVWSGPLASPGTERILRSPTRSRLAQALLAGDVAVWVLVKSGQEQRDRQALQALKSCLVSVSEKVRIPEIGADLVGNPIEVHDFKTYPVHFDLLEVERDNPAEVLLVSSLLKSEPDLEQYEEPMAFPVFGRGRALYALVGKGIQEATIMEACQSLVNWCSCEIKAMNPGTDLLISADWSRPFRGKMVQEPALPLTGLGAFDKDESTAGSLAPEPKTAAAALEAAVCNVAPVSPPAAAAVASDAGPAASPHSRPLLRNLLFLAGLACLVPLVLTAVIALRKKR